jgi:hypothetical protein
MLGDLMTRITIILVALLFWGCEPSKKSEPDESTTPEAAQPEESAKPKPKPETETASKADLFDPLRENYRQALFQTSRGEEEARAAIEKLRAELEKIESSREQWPQPYAGARDRTRKTVHGIDETLERAAKQAESDLGKAHETLEGLRENLAELRGELGVEHPSDTMTRFHTAMERLLARAKQGAVEWERESEAAAELRRLLGRMQSSFEQAGERGCEPDELERAVGAVGDAVEKRDREALRSAAAQLKKAFVELFRRCG